MGRAEISFRPFHHPLWMNHCLNNKSRYSKITCGGLNFSCHAHLVKSLKLSVFSNLKISGDVYLEILVWFTCAAHGSYLCGVWFLFLFVIRRLIEALPGFRAYFDSAKQLKIVILFSIIPKPSPIYAIQYIRTLCRVYYIMGWMIFFIVFLIFFESELFQP